MDFLLLIGAVGIAFVLYWLFRPLHSLGVRKLRHELQLRRVPGNFTDASLKELVALADGPVSLPAHLGFVERRAQFARNVEMLAGSISATMRDPRSLDPSDTLVKVLQKHKIIP